MPDARDRLRLAHRSGERASPRRARTRAATRCSTSSARGRGRATSRASPNPNPALAGRRAMTAARGARGRRRRRRCCAATAATPRSPTTARAALAAGARVLAAALRGLRRSASLLSRGHGHATRSRAASASWGNNIPVAWAFAITNFVWWIGHRTRRHVHLRVPAAARAAVARVDQPLRRGDDALRGGATRGCSRCCTSAGRGSSTGWSRIRRRWACGRSSAARCRGTSAAVSTYFTVSLLFWYLGLVPDLAAARDRAPTPRRRARLRRLRARLARLGARLAAATAMAYGAARRRSRRRS